MSFSEFGILAPKKDKDKEKKEEEKIEGVIKEGNKTIVKGSGAKNLKDLFSKK